MQREEETMSRPDISLLIFPDLPWEQQLEASSCSGAIFWRRRRDGISSKWVHSPLVYFRANTTLHHKNKYF